MNKIIKIKNRLNNLIETNLFFDLIAGGVLILSFCLLLTLMALSLNKLNHNQSKWDDPSYICERSHVETRYEQVRYGNPRQNIWETIEVKDTICDKQSENLYIKNRMNNLSYKLIPADR